MKVQVIPKKLAVRLLVQQHYLHRAPPVSFCFGIVDGDDVSGVVTFGSPASSHMRKGACPSDPTKVLELNRLWVHDKMPRNTETWFLSRALALLPAAIILSYADSGAGHQGIVYRAANFHFAGHTDMDRKTPRFDVMPAEDSFDLLGVVRERHSRDTSRQDVATVRRPRTKKFRYWTTPGNRRERKQMKAICAWPVMSWKIADIP